MRPCPHVPSPPINPKGLRGCATPMPPCPHVPPMNHKGVFVDTWPLFTAAGDPVCAQMTLHLQVSNLRPKSSTSAKLEVLDPVGMRDSCFLVPQSKLPLLSTYYRLMRDPAAWLWHASWRSLECLGILEVKGNRWLERLDGLRAKDSM